MIRVVIDLPDNATSHDFECAASLAWSTRRLYQGRREGHVGVWICLLAPDGGVRVVHRDVLSDSRKRDNDNKGEGHG